MTNQQILEKAIAKAEKNGFDFIKWYYGKKRLDKEPNTPEHKKLLRKSALLGTPHKLLLTDHAFAKAFWGEDKQHYEVEGRVITIDAEWVYGLQEMVITDNWLEYISKFLED